MAKLPKEIDINKEINKARRINAAQSVLIREMLAKLQRLQWVEPNLGEGSEFDVCKECGARDFDGHKAKCSVAEIIAKASSVLGDSK